MSLRCRILDPLDGAAIVRHLAVGHTANHSLEPLEVYAAKRLHHGRRRTGQWWLGEAHGQAVCALMCYSLELESADGRRHKAFGLGAVATVPEARGQGHASRLCEAAARAAEAEGRRVGLLYSAIAPAFYERLGYRVCPAHNQVTTDPGEVARSGPQAPLTARDPLQQPAALIAAYHTATDGRLRVARDAKSWQESWSYHSDEWCFTVAGACPSASPGGSRTGYVRVIDDPEELEILELIPPPGGAPQPLLRAVAALAAALGRPKLCGWLEAPELAGSSFGDVGRARTLPMLKGVTAAEAASARFFGSDYF